MTRAQRHGRLGLVFAAAASLVELAPIVALLRGGGGLIAVLSAGLAYQGGGVLARWIPGGRGAWIAVGVVAVAILAATPAGAMSWFAGLGLLSWALQAARRRHAHAFPEHAPTTARKRMARVAGFILAPVTPVLAAASIAGAAVLAAAWLAAAGPRPPAPQWPRRPIEGVMVVHQMHYFTYCYGLLALLASVAGGPSLIGLWFGVGWITYLSAERLWRGRPPVTALVAGHMIVVVTLAGLAAFGGTSAPAVMFWVLTGFGGGTVYALTCLHRRAGLAPEALEVAEDIGHVGGVALALGLAVTLGFGARALAAVGAAFALATIVGVLALQRRPAPAMREG